MSDIVVYNHERDELGILTPLYQREHEQTLDKLAGYSISLTNDEPLAYVVDVGIDSCPLINAEIVKRKFDDGTIELVGEL